MKPLILGWREWSSLPDLDVPFIKTKIDTGAKTSSLHATNLELLHYQGLEYIKFTIFPLVDKKSISRTIKAKIIDKRKIKSSNGQVELRPIIRSRVKLGGYEWGIDISLTNRDAMYHKFLLGRDAIAGFKIEPDRTYLHGDITEDKLLKAYQTAIFLS